jgi:hypothetical protein
MSDNVITLAGKTTTAPTPRDPPAGRRRSDEFDRAYAAWLAAKARISALEAQENEEGVVSRACDKLDAAEHRLRRTEAKSDDQLAAKFGVLEAMISERERQGPPNDHRHMLMLASFKADLYRFE